MLASRPVIGRISSRWAIPFTRRLEDAEGRFAGVILLSVDPFWLATQFEALEAGTGQLVAMWDNQGALLARSNLSNALLRANLTATEIPLPQGMLRQRFISQVTGLDTLLVAQRLPMAPLFVGLTQPREIALAGFRSSRRLVWAAELVAFLLGLATWLARRQWRDAQRATASLAEEAARSQQAWRDRTALTRVLDGIQGAVFLQRYSPDGSARREYMRAGVLPLLRLSEAQMATEGRLLARAEPAYAQADFRAIYATLDQTGVLVFERQIRCGDGVLRWMRIGSSVIGREGDTLEVVTLLIDIDAEKAAQAELAAAGERLRAELQRALDGIEGAVVLATMWPDGSMVRHFINAGAARMLGRPEGAPVGQGEILQRMEPAMRPGEPAEVFAQLQREGHLTRDVQVRRDDGTLGWLRVHFRAIGQTGETLEVAGIYFDIEAEKQAEAARLAAVLAQKEQLAEVLDSMDAAVFLLRTLPTGGYHRYFINQGAARLLRYPPGELEQVETLRFILEPPVYDEENAELIAELRLHGRAVRERRVHCGDGSQRWMRFHFSVMHEVGAEIEAIALVVDIEAEKAATAAAISSARLASLGEVSAGLAHEMNQPLAIIAVAAGNTAALLKQATPAAVAEALARQDRIIAMTRRAKELTDHLRQFARREAVELEAVSLADTLAGTLLLTGIALRDASVRLETQLPADLPLVQGRQTLLEQVLMNLLLNARDAQAQTPPAERMVRLTAEVLPTTVKLRVEDNGPGLPPQVLARLFEPFFTTKPPGAGTGLGLSICHGILQAAGGSIVAANRPNGGAVFTLTLCRADLPAQPG